MHSGNISTFRILWKVNFFFFYKNNHYLFFNNNSLVSGYGVIFGTNYSAPASACFNVTNGESIPITASGSGQI